MRKFYLLMLAALLSFAARSQVTLPYYQDFDAQTFMADNYLVTQVTNTTYWTTWSGAPGTSEDGTISEAYAASAPNSVLVDAGTDLVFLAGNFTEGRYKVEFDYYIPDGKDAYYNFLQEFGANAKWAYEITFTDGVATIVAGDQEVQFSYNFDTWMHMSTVVDLNADWCEIYWDGVKVQEFVWSYGTSGTNLKQFAAIDFYAAGTDPEYYFDNLAITQLTDLPAPNNLNASVENSNDVVLNWSAPKDLIPDAYSVFRDGFLIEDSITDLTYTDEFVYPKAYEYAVKAVYYGLGVSPDVTAAALVEGGVARKTVLFEALTTVNPDYASYGAAKQKTFNVFEQYSEKVSVIGYNYSDEFTTDEGLYRLFNYYGAGYLTDTWLDGTTKINDYNEGGNMYTTYKPAYNVAIDVPAVVDLDMDVVYADSTYNVSITATEEYEYFDSGLKLHVALVESDIPLDWEGLTNVDYVLRDFLTDTVGVDVDFTDGATQEFNFNFGMMEGVNFDNTKVIAFIQHDPTGFVVQAMNMQVPPIPVTEVSLTFNYDVTCITDAGNEWFMFDTDTLFVTGSFAGWSEPGTEGSVMLSDDDGDKIYSATVVVDTNQTIEYKYFSGPGWNGGEWDGDPNRQVTVAFEDLTVNDVDTTKCGGISVLAESFTGVNLYPNPASDMIYLNGLSEVTKVIMSNVVGQIVATRQLAGEYEIAIPMEDKQSGIYFVTFVDKDNNKYTQKIIKE